MSQPIGSTEQAWPWSLEIRIERIFNNLIKQDQKLGSDLFCNSQQHCPWATVQSPTSRVQRLKSSVQSPELSVQSQESSVQSPESWVQHPESTAQSTASRVQCPILAPRVQKFRYGTKKILRIPMENFVNFVNILQYLFVLHTLAYVQW